MKKIFSLGLVVGMLGILTVVPAHRTSAQTAGLVSALLSRMDRAKHSLKTLRADITMEKYNAQLRDKDTYQGIVLYMPGVAGNTFVRLEWSKPQHETLVVANGNYTLFRPRLGIAYMGKTSSIKSQEDSDVLALMSMSAAQLRTKFGEFQDTRDETLWGGVRTTHFTAIPRTAASYKYIEVWVDDSGMPVQLKMVERNDDATTVRLSNVEKNQNIPMDQFTLKLDSSVKRVKG